MLMGLRVVILSKNAENHLLFLFVGNKHAKLAILTRRCQYSIDSHPPQGYSWRCETGGFVAGWRIVR